MSLLSRPFAGLAAVAAAVVAGALLAPSPAHAAKPAAPSDLQFVEIAASHVDLTFVDRSTNEVHFEVWYKQHGLLFWETVYIRASSQREQTGGTVRINGVTHDSRVGGCYQIVARNGDGPSPASTTRCTAELSRGLKMARLLSWTSSSESSYDSWAWGLLNQHLFTDYGYTWATDYCTASPDQPFGYDFRMPCRRHDFGYRNFDRLGEFSTYKSRVDNAFYADMIRKCNEYVTYFFCYDVAFTYYEAVVNLGSLAVSQAELDRLAARKAELEANATR